MLKSEQSEQVHKAGVRGVRGMNNTEIREQLGKQVDLLSKLSEKDGLTVEESVKIAATMNTLANTLLIVFSQSDED